MGVKQAFLILLLFFGTFLIWASVQNPPIVIKLGYMNIKFGEIIYFAPILALVAMILHYILPDPKARIPKFIWFLVKCFMVLVIFALLFPEDPSMSGTD